MADQFYAITGIPVRDHEAPPARPEISSWSSSPKDEDQIQVSLFIRALRKMQEKDPVHEKLSFYQIAGVHGYPKVPWDGADVNDGFYCTHGVFTFPTWHRPYMLLYEQVLYNIMVDKLIPSIKDAAAKPAWASAAQRWRLPFWDWAIPQSDTGEFGVPGIVNSQKLKIRELGGKTIETVENPLYKYINKVNGKEVSMDDPTMQAQRLKYNQSKQYNDCIGTSRYANPNDKESWAAGSVDNAKVRDALAHPIGTNWEPGKSIADNVYRILTDGYFTAYKPFSSTHYCDYRKNVEKDKPPLTPCEYLSLEMIHNNIHNWTGGATQNAQGHMSDVPVAAFDPIFFLHHCNVDRLFAIWQALNPKSWFDPPLPAHGHDANGKPIPGPPYCPDPKSDNPLPPFRKNSHGEYYSSDSARSTEKLGYTYPELLPENIKNLKARLGKKYGQHLLHLKKPVDDKGKLIPGIGDETFPDYLINVEYDRFAFGGEPYTVSFYLDTYNNQSQSLERYVLGSFYNFTAPVVPDCENCKAQESNAARSKAQVPITLPLQELVRNSDLPNAHSMENLHVEALLQDQLKYSVTKRSGEEIPLEQVPGLLVTVHAGKSSYPDDSLDVFMPSTYSPLWDATQYKVCGAAPA
ncbi:hypothetical protein N7465_006020 [Penicillium sp. CMV-2018d]|nr:hypothetical protein N7465_006020 [Penicillium sp. CMV-2018d]